VSWSNSGNIAYFIEHNTETAYHILLDLKKKKVSRTEFNFTYKDDWTGELFNNLPEDKAKEAYYKIMSTPADKIDTVFDFVLTLKLIPDKRKLIKSLEHYYFSNEKNTLTQVGNGDFDDAIITNIFFAKFIDINPDKIKQNIFEHFGLWTWRP